MNLMEFRQKYPFQPNAIYQHRDGTYLETISWPYCNENQESVGSVFIKARHPHEPTTIKTYRIDGDNPDLTPPKKAEERSDHVST